MPTLEALRRQVEGTEDLQSIVKAMKSISAVRIRQFRSAVQSLDQYTRNLELALQAALRRRPPFELPDVDPARPRGAVLFGADQGLAGQFNARLLELAGEHVRSGTGPPVLVATVGSRVAEHLRAEGVEVEHSLAAPGSVDGIRPVVQSLLPTIEAWRSERDIGRVALFYNRYLGGASYQPERVQLLPVDTDWLEDLRTRPWKGRSLPVWRSPWEQLFTHLIRELLFIGLFRASAESLASENASRLSAMEAAESRIEERLSVLRQELNRQRQQSITQELLEVVAGFEALQSAEEDSDEDEEGRAMRDRSTIGDREVAEDRLHRGTASPRTERPGIAAPEKRG